MWANFIGDIDSCVNSDPGRFILVAQASSSNQATTWSDTAWTAKSGLEFFGVTRPTSDVVGGGAWVSGGVDGLHAPRYHNIMHGGAYGFLPTSVSQLYELGDPGIIPFRPIHIASIRNLSDTSGKSVWPLYRGALPWAYSAEIYLNLPKAAEAVIDGKLYLTFGEIVAVGSNRFLLLGESA